MNQNACIFIISFFYFTTANTMSNQQKLRVAIEKGSTDVVENLLRENSININQQDKFGLTPLFLAVQNEHVSITKLLIQHSANVNIQDKDGVTVLWLASGMGNLEITKLLLDANADYNLVPNEIRLTPIHAAAAYNFIGTIELLVKAGANINEQDADGQTALWQAAEKNNSALIRELCKLGADPNTVNKEYNASAVTVAVYRGYLDVLNVLHECGANFLTYTAAGESMVHVASHLENIQILTLLITKFGLDVNTKNLYLGATSLHSAAADGNTTVIQSLIDLGADVNFADANGWTPLHSAAAHNKINTVKLLLENGALSVTDKEDILPRTLARIQKFEAVADLLSGYDYTNSTFGEKLEL
jgi:ankyrin repeat protein